MFQICEKIDTKDVYVDICCVLTSHLKEYSKALKRHEESTSNSVESLYKKSHPTSNDKQYQSADHYVNLLRIIIKELIPWELWDTPHSELLVRVLSKKFDTLINSTLIDPVWLNDKLLTILKGKNDETESEVQDKDVECKEETEEEKETPEEVITEVNPAYSGVESAFSTLVMKTSTPTPKREIDMDLRKDIPEKMESIVEEVPIQTTEPLDIKSSPILRQRRGRQGRNEVKIYDRVIEGNFYNMN